MMSNQTETYPKSSSRILDVDSHEMIPVHMWGEAFGEEVSRLLAPLAKGLLSRSGVNSTVRDDIKGDLNPITEEAVWTQRGPDAPGAIDIGRRTAVLDAMGIERQLLFPTFALFGINLFYNPVAPAFFGFDPKEVDQRSAGRMAIESFNRWASRERSRIGGDRVRSVAVILTDSVQSMMADAQRLLADGFRIFWIPALPPGDTSPADAALDPFWALAAKSNVPVVLHVGTEFAFSSPAWYANVPSFAYGMKTSIEFPIEPYRASTIHLATEAFLSAMVLGGVFERHPALRFGVIECGAQWLGPLAENLDLWSGQYGKRLPLTMTPSAYLARNVRVTPYHFEPVDQYFERYPELASVYCYGSDYPHIEGGKNSRRLMEERLDRLGADIVESFFIRNGELLLPA